MDHYHPNHKDYEFAMYLITDGIFWMCPRCTWGRWRLPWYSSHHPALTAWQTEGSLKEETTPTSTNLAHKLQIVIKWLCREEDAYIRMCTLYVRKQVAGISLIRVATGINVQSADSLFLKYIPVLINKGFIITSWFAVASVRSCPQ